jgi:His/Glu/Gln/Arg/opine family amino acid ABC transporter permease subunit
MIGNAGGSAVLGFALAMVAPSYQFDFSAVLAAIPTLLEGLRITVILTVVVMAISLPLGLLVAFARLAPFRPLNALAYGYTELFRTTPLLVQLVWFYYVLPITFDIHTDAIATGILALTLNVTAFVAEVFRGGILSIDRGQREAAISTGMTERDAMRRIILPQAAVRSIPLLAAIWISLFKDTSLVAVIGVRDLMFDARSLAIDTFRPMETLTVAAIIYFLLTYPQSVLVNRLFERFRVIE